jgi:hypothetical protein
MTRYIMVNLSGGGAPAASVNQDIGEMLPIPLVSLTPGYKIVKRTSSNTVLAAYVNGYKLPPLYPSLSP